MKQLILVRHAKAEDALPGQSDFERLLHRKGLRDADTMAHRLKRRKVRVDYILTSPAPRARATAEIFARVLNVAGEALEADERLYTAGPNEFLTALLEQGGDHETVLIAAHNPGITEFADKLSAERSIDAMPTCAVATLRFDISSWADLAWRSGIDVDLDYPERS